MGGRCGTQHPLGVRKEFSLRIRLSWQLFHSIEFTYGKSYRSSGQDIHRLPEPNSTNEPTNSNVKILLRIPDPELAQSRLLS